MASGGRDHVPVLIAGAGPAGLAVALALRARGVSCLVVDPRRQVAKVGETLAPNATPSLRRLGVGDLLREPVHLRCHGNRYLFGSAAIEDRSFLREPYGTGWHLDRPAFEDALRERAQAVGAQLWLGAEVQAVVRASAGFQITVGGEGGSTSTSCALLVDATGRAQRVLRRLGVRRCRLDALLGLSCLYPLPGPCPQLTLTEAEVDGWWYAAPIPGGLLAVSFMTDVDLLDPALRTPAGFLHRAARTALLGGLLADARPVEVRAHSAATAYAEERQGAGWLAVGDAAFSLDPLSSHGILAALAAGHTAGLALADHLDGQAAALPAYDMLVTEAFLRALRLLQAQYQREQRFADRPFWARRAAPHLAPTHEASEGSP